MLANRYMLVVGSIKSKNFRCGFGNIYAPNDDSEREAFWGELGSVIKNFDIPWCLGGGFNAVKNVEEKIGVVHNTSSMSQFSHFIDDIGCMDIPMSGGKFTWCSNRRDPSYSRLDRFLISSEFVLVFQHLAQHCLPRSLSDHNAVLLMAETTNWGPKPFKFFNHWTEDEEFGKLVQSSWDHFSRAENTHTNIWDKLRDLKTVIKRWYQQKGADDPLRISDFEEEIAREENHMLTGQENCSSQDTLAKMKDTLWKLYREKERSWLQKSRLKWLQEGDRNNRFFHVTATSRRSTNTIDKIVVQGNLIENPGDIREAITKHFVQHFNSPKAVRIKDWRCNIRSLSMNSSTQLERSFSETEVWNAISRSEGNKASGSDGFNMHFFKIYWSMIKEDMMRFFGQFFDSSSFDKRLNASFIALIPKCASASGLNEFRPISLVGCIYKILANVLANRLRDVLDEVIGPNQFSFIKGRQILDCYLVANEVIDEIKRKGLEV